MEIIFEVREAEEGGFIARALGHSIFTQAETWDELRTNGNVSWQKKLDELFLSGVITAETKDISAQSGTIENTR